MLREIILDTETTGIGANAGHRLIEIGCVEMIDKLVTGAHYHCFVNPERDVPEDAVRVHGITTKFLQDKPLFKAVAADFLAFIADSRLVIHNAAFDMGFINMELERIGKKPLLFDRVTDTVKIARKKFPGAKANLDALCRRYDISLDARDKHGALLDAELLAQVYIHLCGGPQHKLFGAEDDDDSSSSSFFYKHPKARLRPDGPAYRVQEPTPEEAEAHAAFIAKQIKGALWTA